MGTAFAWSPDVVSLLTHWALPFLVVLGVLVAFHEMGHFLAARWVGVKVLKFSLGFGPKIFGRQIGETEYLLSVVPLGGYVKLFGEDEHETLTPEDKKRAFVHQSLWGKTLIVGGRTDFQLYPRLSHLYRLYRARAIRCRSQASRTSFLKSKPYSLDHLPTKPA